MSDRPLVYVTGPVRYTTDYKERFQQGALEVAQLGYEPVNVLESLGCEDLGDSDADNKAYIQYLKRDIRTLLECHGIYLLRGWENSRGARLEKLIADGLDMVVIFQGETDEHWPQYQQDRRD